MQKRNEYNIGKRSRYYLSIMDLDQLEKGVNHNRLKSTFVIFICLFDPFHRQRQKYTFERKCIEVDDLSLNDESSIVVLTNADDSNGDTDIEKFFRYIVSSTTKTADSLDSELITKIHERVLKVKSNRDLEVEFVKLRERDEANSKAGKAAGFKEGALQEKRNIVKTMLGKCTVTDEDICEITGCTQEFIDSIRNSESTDM